MVSIKQILLEEQLYEQSKIRDPVKELKTVFFYPKERDLEFNDQYLMQLVLEHPVLYDPNRYFYGDQYLQPYAWEYLTELFNQKYREYDFDGLFMVSTLQMRWEELVELIKEVGVEPHIQRLPMPMRAFVLKLRSGIMNPNPDYKDIGQTQKYVTMNCEVIRDLPPVGRIEYEKEVIRRIVHYEFTNLKIYPTVQRLAMIQCDCNDVFKLIVGDD